MSVLSDINTALESLGIPLETGVFHEEAPDKYIVVVPMADSFELHADNTPGCDIQEARISLYSECLSGICQAELYNAGQPKTRLWRYQD